MDLPLPGVQNGQMGSSRRPSSPHRAGLTCLWVACAAGLLHAGFSFYWAAGGRTLLDTVGPWAVRQAEQFPVRTGVLLGFIGTAKAAAALIPVAAGYGRIPRPGLWRGISWVGAAALVAYGGLNTAVGNAVLAGLVRPQGGYDRAAVIGHAWLWDPLFLVWGAALLGWLLISRPRTAATGIR